MSSAAKATVNAEFETNGNELTIDLSGANRYQIDLNGQLYSTELSTIKLPIQIGTNKIVITSDQHCDSITKTILVSESVMLFPNPVKDHVNIKVGGDDKDLTIELHDNFGRLFYSSHTTLDENRTILIDLRLLKSGMYHLNLKGHTVFGIYPVFKSE